MNVDEELKWQSDVVEERGDEVGELDLQAALKQLGNGARM